MLVKMSNGTKPEASSSLSSSTTGPPTFKQIYATLQCCLRNVNSSANIFSRLMKDLEASDLIKITAMLPKEELERFVSMVAQRLTLIRMDIGDIGKFQKLCQEGGVSEMPLIRRCDLVPPKLRRDDGNKMGQIILLGQLLPRLEHLNMQATITDPFPVNLRHLLTLIVHQSAYQGMLERICDNCPLLQQLYMRNETRPNFDLDIACVVKCGQLRDLQLLLMLQSAVVVFLILQGQQLWPDTDWLPIVQEIILAKRNDLQRLSLDGTWLTAPLDLSLLQLHRFWALRDVLLSNCKLADPTAQLSLPLSCQRFGLKDCNLSSPIYFLKGCSQLHLLELHKCQMANCGGKLLELELLKHRQRLPTLHRSELISWDKEKRQVWEEFLQIRELNEDKLTWNQSLATITRSLGEPVNFAPDYEQLNSLPDPTYELVNRVSVWWFPPDFCQIGYGEYQESGNHSCTLICLILANKINKTLDFSQNVDELPTFAWEIIGDSINDGNKVYHYLISDSLNICVPKAIRAIHPYQEMDFQLEEWFYTQVFIDGKCFSSISEQLSEIFYTSLKIYQQPHEDWEVPRHLFAAFIADSRTAVVSLDLQTSIAAFFDPHQHNDHTGLVFAQAEINHLEPLMYWYINMLDEFYASRPDMIEVAFLSSLPDVAVRIPPAVALRVDLLIETPMDISENVENECAIDGEDNNVLSSYYLS